LYVTDTRVIDEDEYAYDVKYMIYSGREQKIAERYIKVYEADSGKRNTQGRCRFVFFRFGNTFFDKFRNTGFVEVF
jgi:hypothetical protein